MRCRTGTSSGPISTRCLPTCPPRFVERPIISASPPTIAQLNEIASGPLMRRYSKALEYDYSPDLRRELIEEAEQQHAPQIESALAMLRSAAEKSPLLARALSRAEG